MPKLNQAPGAFAREPVTRGERAFFGPSLDSIFAADHADHKSLLTKSEEPRASGILGARVALHP